MVGASAVAPAGVVTSTLRPNSLMMLEDSRASSDRSRVRTPGCWVIGASALGHGHRPIWRCRAFWKILIFQNKHSWLGVKGVFGKRPCSQTNVIVTVAAGDSKPDAMRRTLVRASWTDTKL